MLNWAAKSGVKQNYLVHLRLGSHVQTKHRLRWVFTAPLQRSALVGYLGAATNRPMLLVSASEITGKTPQNKSVSVGARFIDIHRHWKDRGIRCWIRHLRDTHCAHALSEPFGTSRDDDDILTLSLSIDRV
jgi:hypothetical protein